MLGGDGRLNCNLRCGEVERLAMFGILKVALRHTMFHCIEYLICTLKNISSPHAKNTYEQSILLPTRYPNLKSSPTQKYLIYA